MKIKSKELIINELTNGPVNVKIALEIFDNRVLHGMNKRGEISFNHIKREFYIEKEKENVL